MDISGIGNLAAAWSTRKIVSSYSGACLRATKAGPASQDIPFDGLHLNQAALSTFSGSGSATVSIWYDQSGNERNLTLPGSGAPTLVSSGTIQTNGLLGNPTPKFIAADSSLMSAAFTLNAPFTLCMTVVPNDNAVSAVYRNVTDGAGALDRATIRVAPSPYLEMYGGPSWSGAEVVSADPIPLTAQIWVSQFRTGSGSNSFRTDGVEKLTGNTASNSGNPGGVSLGGRIIGDRFCDFYIRDLIVLSGLPSAADLATIESGLASGWTGASTDPVGGGQTVVRRMQVPKNWAHVFPPK